MTTGADVLRDAFAASCKSLDRILDGVSDEEFFWEPVAGCWTVHRRSESRGVSADGSGEWVIDWDPAQPKPAPFTTIAWRAVHTAGTNYLYWEYAFGSASPTFDLELPGNAADATRFVRQPAPGHADACQLVRVGSRQDGAAHLRWAAVGAPHPRGLDQRAGAPWG